MGHQRVLISSVMSGYEDRREVAAEAISRCGFEPVLAEDLPAQSAAPRDAILKDTIGACRAVVGIYGPRYGWTDSRSGLSPTEEEYDRARELFIPIYAFIDGIDQDELEPRQESFLKKVENWDVGVTRRVFNSLPELGQLIRVALVARDYSPCYRRFLDRLVLEARDLNGCIFREECVPYVPGLDLILHHHAKQFTSDVESYIIVISGDLYDREQVSRVIDNWGQEVQRGVSTTALVVVEDNPHAFEAGIMRRNRKLFASKSFEEMLVDLSSATVELSRGPKRWFNPIKKAVEASLSPVGHDTGY